MKTHEYEDSTGKLTDAHRGAFQCECGEWVFLARSGTMLVKYNVLPELKFAEHHCAGDVPAKK